MIFCPWFCHSVKMLTTRCEPACLVCLTRSLEVSGMKHCLYFLLAFHMSADQRATVLKLWIDSHGRRPGTYFQGCTPSSHFLGVIQSGWHTLCGQLIIRKISKIVATRCQIFRLKCTESISTGALPQTLLGELTVLPRSPSCI